MDPVAYAAAPAGSTALGDLILVVGEDEVHPPAMDVKGVAQVGLAHRTALDVPSRPAGPPGALPPGLPRLGRLPLIYPEEEEHGE